MTTSLYLANSIHSKHCSRCTKLIKAGTMFRVCGSSKLLDRKRQYCASCVALFESRYFTYELVDPMTDEEFAEREKLDEQLIRGIYGEVGGVLLVMPNRNESQTALIGA